MTVKTAVRQAGRLHEICDADPVKAVLAEQLARNLVQQLTVYATGSPIRFSDRPAIDKMLARTRANDYGARSLVHEIVQSELFLKK